MNAELLKRIVRSYRAKDDEAFIKAIQKLIESERRQGHFRLAEDLKELLLNEKTSEGVPEISTLAHPTHLPRSKGEGYQLVDIRRSTKSLQDILLGEETHYDIVRFLEEFSKRDRLAEFGLTPKRKLLFFGPPGNGKTLCAEILAGELDLPFFYVRFDSLIASYLGETATNLRRVFEFASHGLGILFFDEFDAIGKSRDDHEDVGELKRVVNSFLQLLDNYDGASPIIAATNYERLLDYALWRRFDALVFFPKASGPQLVKYFAMRLAPFRLEGFGPNEAAQWCEGSSFSDAARITTEALKTMALSDSSVLTASMFKNSVERYRATERYRACRSINPTDNR